MAKYALVAGIDNYPGSANDLRGCINGVESWAAILEGFNYDVTLITDEQVTRDAIKDWLIWASKVGSPDDEFVLCYNGHGTHVVDISGDETDQYDEAWYLYDGTLSDDELREILNKAPDYCFFVIISDSCHAGTMTRAMIAPDATPRYVATVEVPAGSSVRQFRDLPEEGMCELLIAGCASNEYGWEAFIDGEFRGAFTYYAQKALRDVGSKASYREWYTAMLGYLPSSSYPQTPQLEGRTDNKDLPVFGGNGEIPPDGPGGCLAGLLQAVKALWRRL